MEGDRAAALIIQAARAGVVDFKEARILDRVWWLKLKLLLDDLERDNSARVLQLRHMQHLAAIQCPNVDDTSFNSHWKSATDALGKVTELLFPWYGDMSAAALQQRTIDGMWEAWKRRWGDTNDPKTQANINAVAEDMYRRQRERRAQTTRAR